MSRDERIAKIIHDLRNPINTISVTAELARLQLEKSQDPAIVKQSLDKILDECRKCGNALEAAASSPDQSE